MRRVLFLLCLLFLSTSLCAATTVSTIVGSNAHGSSDGNSTTASFYHPQGIVIDSSKNIFVVDSLNNKIRKITPTGTVTTFAGSGIAGSSDGTGTVASFNFPRGITIDSSENLYVADTNNSTIRKITPAGVVTTVAGSGVQGNSDGIGAAASFNNPRGIAIDKSGNLYVADTNNNTIRKITPAGVVTTVAGSGVQGNSDGIGATISFNRPYGVAADSVGNLYVADTYNHAIRKITKFGVVTTIAGNGSKGSADGTGTAASFYFPEDIDVEQPYGINIYVADTSNNKIRKISNTGVVTTFAGSGVQGNSDGDSGTASFYYPQGIKLSGDDLFVCDTYSNKIRKIHKEWELGLPPPFFSSTSAAVSLSKGWNMISSPFNSKSYPVQLLKDGGASAIWAFDTSSNSYTAPSDIYPGVGYWIFANFNTTVDVPYAVEHYDKVSVDSAVANILTDKWNLVGTPVDTTRDVLKSKGINVSAWWYDPSVSNYSSNDVIKAGSGFWYKADACLENPATNSDTNGSLYFSKPSRAVCESNGGKLYGSCECKATWDQGKAMCTMPSIDDWNLIATTCRSKMPPSSTQISSDNSKPPEVVEVDYSAYDACYKSLGYSPYGLYWSTSAWNDDVMSPPVGIALIVDNTSLWAMKFDGGGIKEQQYFSRQNFVRCKSKSK